MSSLEKDGHEHPLVSHNVSLMQLEGSSPQVLLVLSPAGHVRMALAMRCGLLCCVHHFGMAAWLNSSSNLQLTMSVAPEACPIDRRYAPLLNLLVLLIFRTCTFRLTGLILCPL